MRMLVKLISENKGITPSKLEALAGWRIGLSPTRVREYLTQLIEAGIVEEKDLKLYVKKAR